MPINTTIINNSYYHSLKFRLIEADYIPSGDVITVINNNNQYIYMHTLSQHLQKKSIQSRFDIELMNCLQRPFWIA